MEPHHGAWVSARRRWVSALRTLVCPTIDRSENRSPIGSDGYAMIRPLSLSTILHTSGMADTHPTTLSVSEATRRGVAGLLKAAEQGGYLIVSRHGRPVACVISIRRLEELHAIEGELREMALLLARSGTDAGVRIGLDEAIEAFGFSRAELESELELEHSQG